eukprot:CAMPEP_0168692362 /NCGR_PEP_ID=MMETSP0503-20121227/33186_1 /TAXON_ID=89963 /ORGANISM="Heterocapsa rotundata, Strain SCCAP K-0483" /LENGTH=36 /DNA_ID= /DNA_START= /DNA_END= /DNA_ORIENTATION=
MTFSRTNQAMFIRIGGLKHVLDILKKERERKDAALH